MTSEPTLHVAVPVMDEVSSLPACLDSLRAQTGGRLKAWFCVNQPDHWHTSTEHRVICENNKQCMDFIEQETTLPCTLIDHSSEGRGWPEKANGVGYARKALMDRICDEADPSDIIISFDADSHMPPAYSSEVLAAFTRHPDASGLAAPYYHPLTGNPELDVAMLRYELYMRSYTLNLWRTGSPYRFTALGSSISLPVRSYKKMRRMKPRPSGEDFYLLQHLAKMGRILHWTPSAIQPATRTSTRVPYGTGQAIQLYQTGDATTRYPIYSTQLFDNIQSTIEGFPACYTENIPLPLTEFLCQQLRTDDPWAPLRANHSNQDRFVRACHERLDGLRILQYLKASYQAAPTDDTQSLREWCQRTDHPDKSQADCHSWAQTLGTRSLENLTVTELNDLRDMLVGVEAHNRQADHDRN